MATPRLSMRKIQEILRRSAAGHSQRSIAHSLGIARSTVGDCLKRAKRAEVTWPTAHDDAELEQMLYPPAPGGDSDQRVKPDFSHVHTELRRKGVTLFLLWEEYREAHPNGYQYSWFCEHYRHYASTVDVVMRQHHRAGAAMFVDYAGQRVEVVDRRTGEIREAEIFVAVLGASSYTFAEATWTQSLPDWIGSHKRAFAFFGGVTQTVVPDNLKSGVTRAHRYEPDINRTYHELAVHYGTAIIPARVRKPRDKGKVESGVFVIERWILARLRDQTFFSLRELNQAISELLEQVNLRAFRKLPGCRRELFETLEHKALMPLPAQPYEYCTWATARVSIDYHIEVEGAWYSVPYQLVKKQVDVRITDTTVEVLHAGTRVASHRKATTKHQHTTVSEHMPRAHREYANWSPQRLVRWAEKTGPATATLIRQIMESRVHPQQGYRSCLGILRLEKRFGHQRLEAACSRALRIGSTTYKSVESILTHRLDQQHTIPGTDSKPDKGIKHTNLRGSRYYH